MQDEAGSSTDRFVSVRMVRLLRDEGREACSLGALDRIGRLGFERGVLRRLWISDSAGSARRRALAVEPCASTASSGPTAMLAGTRGIAVASTASGREAVLLQGMSQGWHRRRRLIATVCLRRQAQPSRETQVQCARPTASPRQRSHELGDVKVRGLSSPRGRA